MKQKLTIRLDEEVYQKLYFKADSEYDKYAVIQDRNYISDFDRLIYETEQLK